MASLPAVLGGSWSSQDMIATSNARGPILTWPASGSQPNPIGTVPDGVVQRGMPRWLPDGSGFLFVDAFGTGSWMVRLQKLSGETLDLKPVQSTGAGSMMFDYQEGHLLLATTEVSGRTVLTAEPFDAADVWSEGRGL